MKVIKVTPRGYCHGVVTALNLVAKAAGDKNTKKPIYILGQIVHNKNITDAFESAGVTTLVGKNRKEMIESINEGTVIITAHGIDKNLISLAKIKGLDVIDATCSDVYKTHNIIKEKIENGYEVIYIGKKTHPEPEGVIPIAPDKIHLIETIDDIENLNVNSDKLCITNQTTMSLWDVKNIMDVIKEQYPYIEKINEICLATQQRQEAVAKEAKEADLTIVVGDIESNNTNRLVQVSNDIAKTNAIRINKLEDLDISFLLQKDVEIVAITSGASTPTILTKEIIDFVEQFDKSDENTWKINSKIEQSKIIPRIRKK